MAVGFPASYGTEIELEGGPSTARDAIVSTFELLGWNFVIRDPYTYVAKIPLTGLSWGETVTVSLEKEGMLSIRSACSFQVFDWGKNRRNVNQFLDQFCVRLMRISPADGNTEHAYLDEGGDSPLDRLLRDDASGEKDSSTESTPDSL